MSALIRLKRSAVPGKIPTVEALDMGEMAINTYDGALYLKKDNGTEFVVQVGEGNSIIGIDVGLSTTDPDQIIDSFLVDSYTTAKYLITIKRGTDFHVTELLLAHDGTDVHSVEYGTLFNTSILGTFSADIDAGAVRLMVSPSQTDLVIRMQRIHTGA